MKGVSKVTQLLKQRRNLAFESSFPGSKHRALPATLYFLREADTTEACLPTTAAVPTARLRRIPWTLLRSDPPRPFLSSV